MILARFRFRSISVHEIFSAYCSIVVGAIGASLGVEKRRYSGPTEPPNLRSIFMNGEITVRLRRHMQSILLPEKLNLLGMFVSRGQCIHAQPTEHLRAWKEIEMACFRAETSSHMGEKRWCQRHGYLRRISVCGVETALWWWVVGASQCERKEHSPAC